MYASEEGHQRGLGRGGRGEAGLVRASPTCYRPLAPRPGRGQGGGRARRAHMFTSAVRAPSCVGRLPLRLFLLGVLRAGGAPAGAERGEREGVVRRGRGAPTPQGSPHATGRAAAERGGRTGTPSR